MALLFVSAAPQRPYIEVGSRICGIPAHLPGPSVTGLFRLPGNKNVTDAWAEVLEQEVALSRSEGVISRLRERGDKDPILYTVALSTKGSEATLTFFI